MYGERVDYKEAYLRAHEALMDAAMRIGELRRAIQEHRDSCDPECATTEDEMLWRALGLDERD